MNIDARVKLGQTGTRVHWPAGNGALITGSERKRNALAAPLRCGLSGDAARARFRPSWMSADCTTQTHSTTTRETTNAHAAGQWPDGAADQTKERPCPEAMVI